MIDTTKFTLKAGAETLRRVDEWAARQDPPIRDRGAAIRAMIERVLAEDQPR